MQVSKKTLAIFTVITALMLGLAVLPSAVIAGSSSGTGLDRTVELEVTDSENYTSTANVSVPEDLPENFTTEGTLTHEVINGSISSYPTDNWVNVTISNSSDSYSFSSGAVSVDVNETVSYEITTNVPEWNESYDVEVTLENNLSESDSWSDTGALNVTSNTQWTLGVMLVDFIGSLIPVFVVIAVVIPMLMKAVKSIGDEFE